MTARQRKQTVAILAIILHLVLVGGNHAWHSLLSNAGGGCACGCCGGTCAASHESATVADGDELVFSIDDPPVLESVPSHDSEHCLLCQLLAAPVVPLVQVAAPVATSTVTPAVIDLFSGELAEFTKATQARAPPALPV